MKLEIVRPQVSPLSISKTRLGVRLSRLSPFLDSNTFPCISSDYDPSFRIEDFMTTQARILIPFLCIRKYGRSSSYGD